MIRTVKPNEFSKVHQLVDAVFLESNTQSDEAKLVNSLRNEITYEEDFEVVFLKDNQIIGHGMLSDIAIGNKTGFLALAPLSVEKNSRKQGVGEKIISELERRGLDNGYRAISILGDPKYYSRFGYVPAENYQITTTIDVPTEYYMIKELFPETLVGVSGQVTYVNSFGLN